MLTELCQELRNWFEVEKHYGEFVIENQALSVSFLQTGQYFRIKGSIFNDGVYQYGVDELTDETFTGEIWAMAVPPDVIQLVSDISAWQDQYGNLVASPYQSESFGGYSYSKASGYGLDGNSGYSWKDAFASSLRRYRKL